MRAVRGVSAGDAVAGVSAACSLCPSGPAPRAPLRRAWAGSSVEAMVAVTRLTRSLACASRPPATLSIVASKMLPTTTPTAAAATSCRPCWAAACTLSMAISASTIGTPVACAAGAGRQKLVRHAAHMQGASGQREARARQRRPPRLRRSAPWPAPPGTLSSPQLASYTAAAAAGAAAARGGAARPRPDGRTAADSNPPRREGRSGAVRERALLPTPPLLSRAIQADTARPASIAASRRCRGASTRGLGLHRIDCGGVVGVNSGAAKAP